MFILFATGIHRHPSYHEVIDILGERTAALFEGRTYFHDPDDQTGLTDLGTTSRGHTVRINRRAVEASRLILTGGVVYHYHAGFGGGRKSLVPGLACRKTIAYNHSLSLDPKEDRIRSTVSAGILDGNPVAEEMLEGARLCKPDFIINTILTPDGHLAGVFAGDLNLAHRQACKLAEQSYRYDIDERADFVIAAAETASNWIQAHKALYNADRAVKPSGRIILIAPCIEGLGDEQFRHWITKPDIKQIFAGLREKPEVLGQTALSTRSRGVRAVLVTQMPACDIRDLGIRTAPNLATATAQVLHDLSDAGIHKPTYYLMPQAAYTVPFINL